MAAKWSGTIRIEPDESPEEGLAREERVLRQVFGPDADLDTVDVLCFRDEPVWDVREDGTPYTVTRELPKSGQ